jgi:hypothetical protein
MKKQFDLAFETFLELSVERTMPDVFNKKLREMVVQNATFCFGSQKTFVPK